MAGTNANGQFAEPIVYGAKHKDGDVRMDSRSGGVFTALTDYVLAEGGSVYGCAIDGDFHVFHKRAVDETGRNEFRKSKYCQSDMGDVYNQVKEDLMEGRKVLFSGTSCQVAGLTALESVWGGCYDANDLICVDILCHGVPSPSLWERYLSHVSNKYRGTVDAVEFRDKKKFGWHSHFETFCIGGREISSRDFGTLFIQDSFLRPACYNCRYKSVMHPGDITLGDFWGVDKAFPDFDDNKGVSLVLVNSDKGLSLFNRVKDRLECREAKLEDGSQRIFYESVAKPEKRDSMWIALNQKGIGRVIGYYRLHELAHKVLKRR